MQMSLSLTSEPYEPVQRKVQSDASGQSSRSAGDVIAQIKSGVADE